MEAAVYKEALFNPEAPIYNPERVPYFGYLTASELAPPIQWIERMGPPGWQQAQEAVW